MFPEIPNYRITREIGAGGMAVVYEAVDIRLQRTVAIKVLHPHRCRDATSTDRFMREARAAAKIDHPNVVRIFEYASTGDLHYIVMEFVPGTTAERVLKERGAMPVGTVMTIMSQIAEALAQAHELGIIHRDVKPANILLHLQGRAMLSDFGLAHHLPDPRLTTEDAVAGTPMFMSPEQISGRPLGPATDIYSWAICFYALVAGKLPYRSEAYPDVIAEIRKGTVRFDDALVAAIPGYYLDVLHRCCAADPAERIGDAKELCRQLVFPGAPVPGKIDMTQFVGTTTGATRDVDPSATAVIPKKRLLPVRRAVVGVAMALAVLLAGLVVANHLVRGGRGLTNDAALFIDGAGRSDSAAVSENSTTSVALAVEAPTTRASQDKRDTVAMLPPAARQDAAVNRDSNADSTPPRLPAIVRSATGALSQSAATGQSAAQLPDSGSLFVYCNPWAVVSVNGREIGTTPFEKPVPLPAGTVTLTLTNGFCKPLTDTVTIGAGTVERRKYALEAKPQ